MAPESDFPTARLLGSAIAMLEQNVLPDLSREEARIALDLVIRVLSMLSARHTDREAALETLLSRLQALLGPTSEANAGPQAGTTRVRQLEAERQRLEAKLSHRIPDWIGCVGSNDSRRDEALQGRAPPLART
jgi:hypothetical protein